MKLQKTKTGQYVVTVPKQIVLAKGWDKGTELSIKFDDKGRLLIY